MKIVADDGHGASTAAYFSITVPNTNPDFATGVINTQYAFVSNAYSYTIPFATFTDIDGDSLSYTAVIEPGATPLPPWLTFSAGTQKFSGIPLGSNRGTYHIGVVASDGHGGSTTGTFDLIVPNTEPTIGIILDQHV